MSLRVAAPPAEEEPVQSSAERPRRGVCDLDRKNLALRGPLLVKPERAHLARSTVSQPLEGVFGFQLLVLRCVKEPAAVNSSLPFTALEAICA